MKTTKKILALLLAVIVLFMTVPTFAFAEEPIGGKCGENVYWSYSDGTLTISGTGPTDYYYFESCPPPWFPPRNYIYKDIVEVIIEDGMTEIGNGLLQNLKNLRSVSIPDSVTEIGEYAFKYCVSLTSVTIPDGVTSIGLMAFGGCKSLTSVTIPDGVTSIGQMAFCECESLETIVFPDSLIDIYVNSFNNTAWKNAQPDGLIYIGDIAYSFKGEIPADPVSFLRPDTKALASGLFQACHSIENIVLPDSIEYIGGYTFQHCNELTDVTLPANLKKIGDSAFRYCSALSEIVIPEGVESIGDNAFHNCSALSEIVIPKGVESIGDNAFRGCKNLNKAIVLNPECEFGIDVFGTYNTIYGYAGSTAEKYADSYRCPFEIYCLHENTELRYTINDCITEGYSADMCCRDCGKILEKGTPAEPFGQHDYVNAVCSRCGSEKPYDEQTFFEKISTIFRRITEFFRNLFGR